MQRVRTYFFVYLGLLTLLFSIGVFVPSAEARTRPSLDEPIREGIVFILGLFQVDTDTTLSATTASVSSAFGSQSSSVNLPAYFWLDLTESIGAGMYAAYCTAFCNKDGATLVLAPNVPLRKPAPSSGVSSVSSSSSSSSSSFSV